MIYQALCWAMRGINKPYICELTAGHKGDHDGGNALGHRLAWRSRP